MNEIYDFVLNGATDPLQQVFHIVLFLIVFEGVMGLINMLMEIFRGDFK
jgi:nucleoside permease NupC